MNEPRRFSVGVEPDQEEDDQGFHDPQAADARVVEGSRVHFILICQEMMTTDEFQKIKSSTKSFYFLLNFLVFFSLCVAWFENDGMGAF